MATDTTTDTSALKAAAAATKLAATDATSVLQDTVATLDALNTQINAVRTNVEALVLELRKYYPDGEITAVLNTAAGTPAATTIDVTNPNSIYYAQSGVWEIPIQLKQPIQDFLLQIRKQLLQRLIETIQMATLEIKKLTVIHFLF